MKRFAFVITTCVAMVAGPALAETLFYWDLNQGTENVAGPLSGTWDGVNVVWNTDTTGGSGGATTATTTSVDDLVISSGSVYSGGMITISGAQIANSLTFRNNNSYARTTMNNTASGVSLYKQSSNIANWLFNYGITVNSGGTTITVDGVQSLTFFRDNTDYDVVNGTGNLVFNNNSPYSIPLGIDLNGAKGCIAVNNAGTITNSGTGLGGTRIDAQITANVTAIVQKSATSTLYLMNAISTPGAGAVTQNPNTFTGPVSINAGILYCGYDNALTTAGSIAFGGGTLMYGAASATDLSAKFITTNNAPYSVDCNNLDLTFAATLAASGTSGLRKLGPGTLTLSAANTYTGITAIGGGTGTLERLAGGTLTITGSLNDATGTDLTFDGTGTFTYGGNMQTLTLNAGDATLTSPSTFSSFVPRTAGATGNFPVTILTDTNSAPLDTGSNDQGLFFGGSSYARYDTANNRFKAIVYGADSNAVAAVAGGDTLGINDAVMDVQITGTISAQTTAALNTLHVNGAHNVLLADGAKLSINGLLKSGGSASAVSGGAGITPTASGNELVIRTGTASDVLTIHTPILANGTNTLTKSGAGTLMLSGVNTHTGNTVINQGKLILDTPADWTCEGVISGAGALVVTGPGTLTLGKKCTFTGGLTISAGTLQLDLSAPGAPTAEIINGVNTLALGSADVLNLRRGGGTLLIKARSSGITAQNLSVPLPPLSNPGVITYAGANKILVDPNGGLETQVLMGMLENVIMRNGNSERVASNGSTLLIGKSAGAGSGSVIFTYSTDGRNGSGYGGNMPARLVYTSDGGSDVDFVAVYDNISAPYAIIPVGTAGYNYTPLMDGGSDGNAWFRLSGSDASVTLGSGNGRGLKIANPDAGKSITITGTWTPSAGIIMTGSSDFTIQGGYISSDNNANARAYVFQQYSTGTLTISSALNQTGAGNCVVKSGPGRLVLSGANTYTGPLYLNEGILGAGSGQNGETSGPFGTSGIIIFSGGTLQYSAANQYDYSYRFSVAVGQPISIDTFGQNVTLATALKSSGGTLTVNDTASTKGKLTISGNNTYTGGTTISGGSVMAGNASSSMGTGPVMVKAGATLGGDGTISGAVTVESGGHLAPGLNGSGALTLSGTGTCLIFTNNAVLDCEIGGSSSAASSGLVKLTATDSTIGFGTNAVLNLFMTAGMTSYGGSRVVLFTYVGKEPVLPEWTINYGDTGCGDGVVYHDKANKQIALTLTPKGSVIVIR